MSGSLRILLRTAVLLSLALTVAALPSSVQNVNVVSRSGNGRTAPNRNPSSLKPKSLGLRGGSGSALSSFINFCDVQHLPIGILIAIFVGLSNPDLGVKAGENKFFATWSIPTIFFINGVKIKAEEAKKAVKNLTALGWGSFCILFMSAVIGCQLGKFAPLKVKEFITGIAVFSCLPSTTVSSPMLAAKAGGNFALALLLTLLVNVIGVFSTPFLLKNLVGISGGGFSVAAMIKRLAITSLTPLVVGKAVTSASSTARDLAAQFSKLLTYISSGVIIFQPWVAISRSTKKGVFARVTGTEVFILTVIVTVMHLMWQGIEYLGCVGLDLSLASTKSVCIVGAAKNLPLALALVGLLPATTGDTGLLTLPIVLGHFSTIVCDSILGNYWAGKADGR